MAKLENIYNVKDMEMAIQAGCKSKDEEIKKLSAKVKTAYDLITQEATHGKCNDWNAGFDIL